MRTSAQRHPPKGPHKPSSQTLGARTLNRQHWRKAASLMWPARGGETQTPAETERAARVHRADEIISVEQQGEQAVHPHEPRAPYLTRAADALDHV